TDIVDNLLLKVRTFGCYFATLDIRQDSSALRKTHRCYREKYPEETGIPEGYHELDEPAKAGALRYKEAELPLFDADDPLVTDTMETIRLIKLIQRSGGE